MNPYHKTLYRNLVGLNTYQQTIISLYVNKREMLIKVDLFTDFVQNDKGLFQEDEYYVCGLYSFGNLANDLDPKIDPIDVPLSLTSAYFNSEVITDIFMSKTDALYWMHKITTIYS